MPFTQISNSNIRKCVLGVSIFASSLAFASTAFSGDMNATTYQQQRAACMDGQTYEDRATCLKEASAANYEAKRGQLVEDTASYEQNEEARCKVLPEADRADCIQRVHGKGIATGSVASGGIYRETDTTVVVTPQPNATSTLQSNPNPAPPASDYQIPVAR